MPPYNSPKDLRGLRQDFIPDGDFILPICTNRERFVLMLEALHHFRSRTEDRQNLDHMIDFLESWAYLGNPQDSPCFPNTDTTHEEHECVDYPTDATIITYAPQNPFTQPDYIPSGYIAVPFLVVHEGDPLALIGFEPGDVLTGYLSAPILTPALDEGLARIRVRFTGTGVVELHLIKIPGGGMAVITHDDNPFTAQTVVLNKDIVQLPPETNGELIIEIPFETPGDHHIDISFIARFNDELTFLTYGGGLRSVVLCGFDATLDKEVEERVNRGAISIEEDTEMGLRISPDDCRVIQRECSPGEWVDWYNPFCQDTSVLPVVQPPPAGTVDEGGCKEFDVVLQGNGQYLLPVPIDDGYVITISNTQGGWSDGAPVGWRCPNGFTYALGVCVSADPAHEGDPLMTTNHMRLLALVDDVYYDAYNKTITVPSGTGEQNLFFQANDSELGDNQGSISFHVTVCRPAAETFVHVFDFLASDGEWVAYVDSPPHGTYVPGVGWQSNAVAGCGQLSLTRDFDGRTITRIITEYYRMSDAEECGGAESGYHNNWSTSSVLVRSLPVDAGSIVDDWVTGGVVLNDVLFRQRIDSVDVGGVTLTRITVYGMGTDPF